jgi:hypothetical protein
MDNITQLKLTRKKIHFLEVFGLLNHEATSLPILMGSGPVSPP